MLLSERQNKSTHWPSSQPALVAYSSGNPDSGKRFGQHTKTHLQDAQSWLALLLQRALKHSKCAKFQITFYLVSGQVADLNRA
jgi:hypothetical protein